eukprot:403346816
MSQVNKDSEDSDTNSISTISPQNQQFLASQVEQYDWQNNLNQDQECVIDEDCDSSQKISQNRWDKILKLDLNSGIYNNDDNKLFCIQGQCKKLKILSSDSTNILVIFVIMCGILICIKCIKSCVDHDRQTQTRIAAQRQLREVEQENRERLLRLQNERERIAAQHASLRNQQNQPNGNNNNQYQMPVSVGIAAPNQRNNRVSGAVIEGMPVYGVDIYDGYGQPVYLYAENRQSIVGGRLSKDIIKEPQENHAQ